MVGSLVLGLGVWLALGVTSDPSLESGKLLGKTAPAFSGTTLDGKAVSSTDLAGKSVLVNFWNDWCIPCRQELPALKEFYRRHKGEADFAMVGIVRDARSDRAIDEYAQSENIDWTVMRDPGDRAALDFATTGQPETFTIDPRGVVVGFQSGPSTVDGLEQMLQRARGLG